MSLEVITGCMFSGKTEELVRRLRRCRIAGLEVIAFKPAIDNRYHEESLASHLGSTFEAIPVENVAQMRGLLHGQTPPVLGFDEAQFMNPDLILYLDELANLGTQVIVAGLDLDYQGKPFGPMPHLMAIADKVTKLHAVCVAETATGEGRCGRLASRSYRIPAEDKGDQVQVGAADSYEARCRLHWWPPR